jgi:hypothetical protein
LDAAAGREDAPHGQTARLERADEIGENPVYDVLVEDAETAIGVDVFLQGLQLDASGVGHVRHRKRGEVGQTRLRADGRELRNRDDDFVVSRELRGPGLESG